MLGKEVGCSASCKKQGVERKPQCEYSHTGLARHLNPSSHPPYCLRNQFLWLWSVQKHLRNSAEAQEFCGSPPKPERAFLKESGFFGSTRQRKGCQEGGRGEDAYLYYETWHIGGRAQTARGSHRPGCPGHGTPCLGRVWKRGGVHVRCLAHTGTASLRPLAHGAQAACASHSSATSTPRALREPRPAPGVGDRLCPWEAISRGK